MCQRCLTRQLSMHQLESVRTHSVDLYEEVCLGLLDAVANSTMKHAGVERAAMRFYAHGDICVALAAPAPLVLPKQTWRQKIEPLLGPVYIAILSILLGMCVGVRIGGVL